MWSEHLHWPPVGKNHPTAFAQLYERALCPISLTWEKIKVKNLKYSFYWTGIFTTVKSKSCKSNHHKYGTVRIITVIYKTPSLWDPGTMSSSVIELSLVLCKHMAVHSVRSPHFEHIFPIANLAYKDFSGLCGPTVLPRLIYWFAHRVL